MQNEIIAAVKAAGVVGAGGAGFPTHIKIDARVDIVIANGAECEPLLRAHQHLMAAESDRLICGLSAVMLATGARRGYIGLKKKYAAATAKLTQALSKLGDKRLDLFFLPDFYPAGDEHVLVHEITGRIVPESGIPLNVKVVVANIETLVNVARALENIPVTAKYLTITGDVGAPVTLAAPIGTKAATLLALAGGTRLKNPVLLDGGPMMGKIITPDHPITKTTGGLVVLPGDHPLITRMNTPWTTIANRAKAACCGCRACTDTCPRYLLGHSLQPHRIMQALSGHGDNGGLTGAMLCSECGVCDTFGCTMGLSPRRVNAELKARLAKAGIKPQHNAQPERPRTGREYRRIPTKRMIDRLALTPYDLPAPYSDVIVRPQEVRLPLKQHIGAPAEPVVRIGDQVKAGDLIAAIPAGAAVGANLHASITGQIFAVAPFIGIKASD